MKNLMFLLILSLFFVGCGDVGEAPDVTPKVEGIEVEDNTPESCTVEQNENGATIKCPDGTVAEITNGTDGGDGANGQDGEDGVDGDDGSSCSVSTLDNGALITCDDGTSSVILNGQDGQSSTIDQVLEVVDPCGPEHPKGHDELLLRLPNGRVFGVLNSDDGSYMIEVGTGRWETSDGTNCQFTVNGNGEIVGER